MAVKRLRRTLHTDGSFGLCLGGPFGAPGLRRSKHRGNVFSITLTSSPGTIGLGEAVAAWLAAEFVC